MPVGVPQMRILLAVVMVLSGCAHAQAAAPSTAANSQSSGESSRQDYEYWVRRYHVPSLVTADGFDKEGKTIIGPALVVLTTIEGDDLPVDEKQASLWGKEYRVVAYGCGFL